MIPSGPAVTRRALLAGAAALAATPILPRFAAASAPARAFSLRAAPGTANLLGPGREPVAVWSYDGTVPGPEIRARQGERIRIEVANALDEETTVHWHGIRVPNAMDGVPNLTQAPVAPGGSFTYEFDLADAGTFWYHPHQRSSAQVGRGLSGALIVEEREPYPADRDIVWLIGDWRLDAAGAIDDDFDNPHDAAHGGRIGNHVTINGRAGTILDVRSGERIRLRLVNVANARIFGLEFPGFDPVVIALDGQPVAPYRLDGMLVLGPAMRADILLDATGEPGERHDVTERFYGPADPITEIIYAPERVEGLAGTPIVPLAANPLAEPDPDTARRHEVVFAGGMMGQQHGPAGGMAGMAAMMGGGAVWTINGQAGDGHSMDPLAMLELGQSHIFDMRNETAWHHPIHLHGHAFRVLARNGQPTLRREWLDTVLMAPNERVEIALVADNPGDWMFHCHILEHQAAGMMAVLRVA